MEKHFEVAGTQHYLKELLEIVSENPDFDERKSFYAENYFDGDRIYKYEETTFENVELIDEPENEYDPKAIRVEIDGVKVGYVKKGSTSEIRNLLKNPNIKVTADFHGGPYKDISFDEDDRVEVDRGEYGYYIKLTFTERKPSAMPKIKIAYTQNPEQETKEKLIKDGQNEPTYKEKQKKETKNIFLILAIFCFVGGLVLSHEKVIYLLGYEALAVVFFALHIRSKKKDKK